MVYSLESVRKLKRVTGIGIKKCIEALKNSNGDFEKSLEWLKNYSASLRNFSSFNEEIVPFGVIFLRENNQKVVSFILGCESDFAEKTESFINLSEELGDLIFEKFEILEQSLLVEGDVEKLMREKISNVSLSIKERISVRDINFFTKKDEEKFGLYLHHNRKLCSLVSIKNGTNEIAHEIALQVAVHRPLFISKEFIPAETIKLKFNEFKENLSDEIKNKNPSIIENVVLGKLNKWYSEVCLLEKKDFRDHDRLLSEIVSSCGISIEKIFYKKI